MRNKIIIVTPIYILAILLLVSAKYSTEVVNSYNQQFARSQASTASAVNSLAPKPVKHGIPSELSIPSLGFNININQGTYNTETQTWTLTNDAAYYAVETNQINDDKDNGGLTLIYGHNTKEVFKVTNNLEIGDIVEVVTEDSLLFSYLFTGDEIVQPDDTSIFDYQGKPRLVLMACTGKWNENRRIMNFDLISVRNL